MSVFIEMIGVIILMLSCCACLTNIVGNEPVRGIIIACVGFTIYYILKKLSQHESYKKKMYDLMKESVELQKKQNEESK